MAPGQGATRDDLVLSPAKLQQMLAAVTVVEEKLDGANVSLWLESGRVMAASRGGSGSRDRAGQMGRLRAWLAPHTDGLQHLLARGDVLYAEWLFVTHTVYYSDLPDYLVGLDIVSSEGRAASLRERNTRLEEIGLCAPPRLFGGRLETIKFLDSLLGQSVYGCGPAEGVVIRVESSGNPTIAKRLRPGFARLDNADWKRGRPHNGVSPASTNQDWPGTHPPP